MGAPKKWFKAFLGLRRSDRSQSTDKDGSCSGSTSVSNRSRHFVEVGDAVENELNVTGEIGDAKDVNPELFTGSFSSPSSSPLVQNAAQSLGYTREEWAARKIQAAVTQFLSSGKVMNQRDHSVEIGSGILEHDFNHNAEKTEDGNDANLEPVSASYESASASHQSSEITNDIWHQMGCAAETGFEDWLNHNAITENEVAVNEDSWLVADSASSVSHSLPVPNEYQVQPSMSQEQAIMQIQRAFRHFLARKRLRALKGLVRLQGLIRDHAVRKQAATTLHCMQSVVRVQASVQARSFRMALRSQTSQQKHQDQVEPEVDAKETEVRYQESQTEQQKHQNQLEHEVHVKETEDGWCDSVGSAEQIQAKLLKRREATAKREKAKAYALARQWQARPREQVASSGFQTDNSNWSWNWLERWMPSGPWENRLVDINLNNLMQSQESKPTDDAHGAPVAHSISTTKKPISKTGSGKMSPRLSNNSDTSNGKNVVPYPDGSSSHFISSVKTQQRPRALVSSKSLKSVPKMEGDGATATSKSKLSSRSRSTPKERVSLMDKEKINPTEKQGKKRLSLPGNGPTQGAQPSKQPTRTAVKKSPTAPRPTKAKPKPTVNDIKPSPLSPQSAH